MLPTCRWTRPCCRRCFQKSCEACPRRKLVDRLKVDWKVSIRRACSVLKVDRSLYVYKSRRGEQAELKLKIKCICQTRVRYGYRRVHILRDYRRLLP
ncbi:IS3 family transposase [Agrobacterium tumefaciens]|nr:IS3 family transposase [Agrobacterium tumefaciens]